MSDDLNRSLAALDPLADPGFSDRMRTAAADADLVDGMGGDLAADLAADLADGGAAPLDPTGDTVVPIGRPRRRLPAWASVAAAAVLVVAGGLAVWALGADQATTVDATDTPGPAATADVVDVPRTPATPSTTAPDAAQVPATSDPAVAAPDDGQATDSAEPSVDANRDPLLQPFAWDSPWNMPIGDAAVYVPANIEPPANGPTVEEAIIVLTPDAPERPVYRTTTAWGSGPPRCTAIDESVVQFDGLALPIPDSFTTEAGERNQYPGHAGAVLGADGRTVHQSQPLHVCNDGRAASRVDYPADDVRTGTGIEGAHGGSGLSSLGGTLRLADLDGERIPHALKLTIDAGRFVSPQGNGYRWPAVKADAYVDATTGSCRYGGSEPALQMGALLALTPDFDAGALETDFARLLARALTEHGGYVVGDTCRDAVGIVAEWGPDGRVTDAVLAQHGIDMTAAQAPDCTADSPTCRYSRDMALIIAALHVVDDNEAASPGGTGARLAPCAAPFSDGTGGPPGGSICD
ncbi:MAG: hypothetical protein AAF467_17975 [Actinomycetota bacterium]